MDSSPSKEARLHIEKIRKDKFGIEPDGTKHPNSLERDHILYQLEMQCFQDQRC